MVQQQDFQQQDFQQPYFHQSSCGRADINLFLTSTRQENSCPARILCEFDDGADVLRCADSTSGDIPEDGPGADDSLEDVARGEREYVRERLRHELNREPTEEEIDDWLQRHTEGY
jgi:hypothetical protein